MDLAIEIKGLYKTYVQGIFRKRKKEALKNINLTVPYGSIWGILGPNGAGKTTLISIIGGLLIPDKGLVNVLGKDIHTHMEEICKKINLSSGHANFPWSMTVEENLSYYAMLYGISGKKRKYKIEQLLDLFSLEDYKDIRFEELSTGTKQRLSLAKAFINDPELILLDEPTVGLDPDIAMSIRETIRWFHKEKGTTFIITTHNMKEAEILCDQVSFIFDGRIKAKGIPEVLKKELRLGDIIKIEFMGKAPSFVDFEGILEIDISDSYAHIIVDDHKIRLPQLINEFIKDGVFIREIKIDEADLEDVFINFTR